MPERDYDKDMEFCKSNQLTRLSYWCKETIPRYIKLCKRLEAERDEANRQLVIARQAYKILNESLMTHTIQPLENRVEELREALGDAIYRISQGRKGCIGDHTVYTPQINTKEVDRWRKAIGKDGTGDE